RVLDELLQTCVEPRDCPVCEVSGRRLAPGRKVTLNPEDPARCQTWYPPRSRPPAGRVCGLCGNFDGVQNNDLTSSSLRVEEDPVDFGNSWKVSAQCADARKAPLGMAPTLCGGDLDRQSVADSSCRILTSDLFHACNQLVDPEPYLDVCVYDTCSCESVGDCACFCDTIAAYAHACAQQGQVVAWRTPTLCPQSCEDRNARENGYECEWRYNSCAPACPITCQHPEPLACPVQCVEGCHAHCPP
ncbi:PREDICTED: von Willebrand factor-like, partial [Dipodomys ordii]|uniref:von Willebrand factor-like n=1 Tax=Dipodomys ordii TaxID=10020 RepID=A0A1S3GXI2_DIPOR